MVRELTPDEWHAPDEERAAGWREPRFNRRKRDDPNVPQWEERRGTMRHEFAGEMQRAGWGHTEVKEDARPVITPTMLPDPVVVQEDVPKMDAFDYCAKCNHVRGSHFIDDSECDLCACTKFVARTNQTPRQPFCDRPPCGHAKTMHGQAYGGCTQCSCPAFIEWWRPDRPPFPAMRLVPRSPHHETIIRVVDEYFDEPQSRYSWSTRSPLYGLTPSELLDIANALYGMADTARVKAHSEIWRQEPHG